VAATASLTNVTAPQGRQSSLRMLGALGVVYGDIGTSPLYAMRSVLGHADQVDRDSVYGLTSTVVWSMTVVVSILYVGVLLARDNQGEGGLLALVALVRRESSTRRVAIAVSLVGMVGASLFLGDSVITPAISVLSAAEGLRVASPSLDVVVLPVAVVVLGGVFLVQRVGSGRIGRLYGPIMLAWFVVLAAAGVSALVSDPGAFVALSPHWAVGFFIAHPGTAFLALSAVVLTVTGAEALYADLGHFGRAAITRSWFGLVFPCLVLGYLGEAAYVVEHPAAAADPFYAVVPEWATIPVLALATLATIIASEAVIAGSFTVLHQASGLGLFPHLRTRHPSSESGGQIYVPAANWMLAGAVLAVVVGFRSSSALASAYGLAVSATICVTVSLYVVLARLERARRRLLIGVMLQVVMLAFLAATFSKFLTGGWLPTAIAVVLFVVMWSWWAGQRRLGDVRRRDELSVPELLDDLHEEPHRHAGTAVFLAEDDEVAPFALRWLLERESVLHECTVVLSWQVDDKPSAPPHETSVRVEPLDEDRDVVRVHVTLGYRDRLDVETVLRHAVEREPTLLGDVEVGDATYFVSDPLPRLSSHGGLPRWQQRLFVTMDRMATDRVEQLRLPRDRAVIVGREFAL
jgi:KUP system potassium uptake protein